MENMQYKISVIIPALNEEKLLARTLESLRKQTYPRSDFEIVVADNGSTDRTAEIARQFGANVYEYTDIKRCGATRQFGATKAKAPILAFTDADAVVPKDWLSTIDTLLKDPKLVCVGGKVIPDGNNFVVSSIFAFYNFFHLFSQRFYKTLLWGSNLAVRKDAYEKVGGYNTSISTSDDWDLVLRLQKKYGKESVIYSEKLRVYVSSRRQSNPKALFKYSWDGISNYINVVMLGRLKSSDLETVR